MNKGKGGLAVKGKGIKLTSREPFDRYLNKLSKAYSRKLKTPKILITNKDNSNAHTRA